MMGAPKELWYIQGSKFVVLSGGKPEQHKIIVVHPIPNDGGFTEKLFSKDLFTQVHSNLSDYINSMNDQATRIPDMLDRYFEENGGLMGAVSLLPLFSNSTLNDETVLNYIENLIRE